MKRTLRFICLLLITSMIITGCSLNFKKETVNDVDGSLSRYDGSKITFLFLHYNADNTTYEIKDNDDEMVNKIEESLSQNGFYVDLKPYYMFSKNAAPRISYIDTIKQNLASGSIDAFHIPSYFEKYQGSDGLDSILNETMNIKDILEEKSSVLYKKLIENGAISDKDKKISYITMYGRNVFAENNRIRVVLSGASAKKYQIDSMDTFEDYVKFLRKVKSQSNATPGYITPFYNLMIALQDSKHYYIDDMLSSVYYEMPMFTFSYDDKEMRNPIPFESIPGMKEKLMKINNLYREGLLAYGKNAGDMTTFFRNRKNTQSAQMLELQGNNTESTEIFSSLASFCGSWEDNTFLPLLEGSKVFILNSKTATIKDNIASYDRVYLSKYTKNAGNIIKLLENIYLNRNITDIVKYGNIGEDYNLENGRVKILFEKKAVNDIDRQLTHYYRNIDNFKFLQNSEFERYDSKMPTNYEQESSKLQKVQSELLPFEKIVEENRHVNLQVISSQIRQSIFGEKLSKSGGNSGGVSTGTKCNVVELSISRFSETCLLLDRIWAPDFEKLYDEFVKSQNPKDIEAIKEYYRVLLEKLE